MKYLKEPASVTQLVIYLGVHECIDHIHISIERRGICIVRCAVELVEQECIGCGFSPAVQCQFACGFLTPKNLVDYGEVTELRGIKSTIECFWSSEKRFIPKITEGPLSTSSSLVVEM